MTYWKVIKGKYRYQGGVLNVHKYAPNFYGAIPGSCIGRWPR